MGESVRWGWGRRGLLVVSVLGMTLFTSSPLAPATAATAKAKAKVAKDCDTVHVDHANYRVKEGTSPSSDPNSVSDGEQVPATRTAARPAGSVTVNTYVHVITNGSGGGAVTAQEISDQLAVMNAAYGGQTGGVDTPFRFTLAGTDTTANNAWYTATPGTPAEQQMKNALHVGDSGDLNIYTNNMGGGLLGWATFPWDYTSAPSQDGIVVLYSPCPSARRSGTTTGETRPSTRSATGWACTTRSRVAARLPATRSPTPRLRPPRPTAAPPTGTPAGASPARTLCATSWTTPTTAA